MVPARVRDVLRPFWGNAAKTSNEGDRRAQEIADVGPAQRWDGLQQHELDFWDNALASVRTNPNKPLQEHLRKLIDAGPGSKVEILDVGAGPLTYLGQKWPERELGITALDPNAAEYDRLLAKHCIEPPCRTVFGYVEDLSSVVPESFFDLVHARNCIDHSKDPLKAIREMVRAVKPGCCVYLNHWISEGRRNKYGGPHQWNLFHRDGRFLVDRPGMEPVDVGTETVNGVADVTVVPSPDGAEWFAVIIRRRT
jgi:SAM-dependent methyltransferase